MSNTGPSEAGSPAAGGGAARRTVVFLLPIFNEGERLDALLTRIAETMEREGLGFRVVAVDDGSSDDSPAILQRRAAGLPLEVITHRFNRGLGDTLRDGAEWVADHAGPDDVVVMMDADDTHDPAYVRPMLERLDAGADVVIASRFQSGAEVKGVPGHRQTFSIGANLLLRAFLRIPGVQDYACGFRAIRADVLRRTVHGLGNRLLELRGWGFICTAELLWKLSLFGARCDEIPFTLRYDLKASASKMRAVRTILGYGLLIWKSLISRPATA